MRLIKFMLAGIFFMLVGSVGVIVLTVSTILVGTLISRAIGVTNPDLVFFIGMCVVLGGGGGALAYWMEDGRWS